MSNNLRCWGEKDIAAWKRRIAIGRIFRAIARLAWWTTLIAVGYAASQVIGGAA